MICFLSQNHQMQQLGHIKSYQYLKKQFKTDNVFFALTASQQNKSDFSLAERKKILTDFFKIDENHIITVQKQYHPTEIRKVLGKKAYIIVFAISEKDISRLQNSKKHILIHDKTDIEHLPAKVLVDVLLGKKYLYTVTPTVSFTVLDQNIQSSSEFKNIFANASEADKKKMLTTMYKQSI